MRPLLGTFVEVRIRGLFAAAATAAIEQAFAAVARVEALMSPREPSSDLARLNSAAPGKIVSIDPWTHRVLAAAHLMSLCSGGVFDATAIPGWEVGRMGNPASWRDLVLLPGCRARILRSLHLDLGGIAKGFAVDCAVQALQAAGAKTGMVNAGGDLRAFGPVSERVHVRHPAAPGMLVPVADLIDEAMATSANYLDPRGAGRLVHPRGGRLWLGCGSVSVRAPSCLLADALCKVAAAEGPRPAAALLRACGASALVLTRQGRIWREGFVHAT